jgi:hypothetical protein
VIGQKQLLAYLFAENATDGTSEWGYSSGEKLGDEAWRAVGKQVGWHPLILVKGER